MKRIIIALSGIVLTTSLFAQTGAKPTTAKPATTKPTTAKPATGKPTTASPAIVLKNNRDSASYALGVRIAQNLKEQSFDKLDPAIILKGINDVFNNKAIAMPDGLLDQCIGTYQQKASYAKDSAKASVAKAEGQKFLTENGKRKGVITTKSGLQYEIIKAGTDTIKPKISDKVKCHYHGTLINGTVFDSSVDRGEPISFAVGGVIAGWTEALQLMTVGSKWKLYIPSELAYGNRAAGDKIVPGSTLIFEVEILAIEK
jgi:FKBP-type peptidyl-prolyl cis-trans isomerase FklB